MVFFLNSLTVSKGDAFWASRRAMEPTTACFLVKPSNSHHGNVLSIVV